MIKTFRHKGLQRFFSTSDRSGISAQWSERLRRVLDRLDAAAKPEDMNVPGYKFHALKGERKGSYAVWISGNWRLTFGFKEGEAINVNLEDYY